MIRNAGNLKRFPAFYFFCSFPKEDAVGRKLTEPAGRNGQDRDCGGNGFRQ